MNRVELAYVAGRWNRAAARLVVAAGLAMGLGTAAGLVAPRSSHGAADAPGEKATETNLPVRKITLYRSGVGYFERAGSVEGNSEIQLRFNTDQINDILKSMVLLDLDGGRVESVAYGSKEPLAKRLASFGINIADNPSAGEILQRLRGTPVKVTSSEGDASGTIMNVESRPTVYPGGGTGGTVVHNLPWINLLSDKGVKSVNLANVTAFELLDKPLAEELNKALSALAEYRADRTKTVDLRFAGSGSRRVVVGYVHEMPVWKTSYRLVLPEGDDKGGKQGELMMQGWAIVENTTDHDWNNVRLGLVSGRPVSFQMDLYEPLFMARPWVSVPTIAGVTPRAYALGVDLEEKDADAGTMQSAKSLGRNAGGLRAAPGAPAPAREAAKMVSGGQSPFSRSESADYSGVSGDDMAAYAQRAQATAAEVGEVFQFQVDQPVSIERQRSAMIPIISTNIPGRRVSIFNLSEGSEYPRRGVEIKNTADLQLLPGPISVFDGAAYAGDAQIGQIPKGDKRLLSYALDLNVTAINKSQRQDTVTKIKIVDGLLVLTSKLVNTINYDFTNRDQARGRTIIVEHPKWSDWKLVAPDKPSEETADLYRFEVEAEAGKNAKLEVRHEMVQDQRTGIVGYDINSLVQFNKSGKLSDAVLRAVNEAAAKQAAINATEREIVSIDQQVSDITNDQTRVRQNMQTIDRNSKLYTTYMTKFTEQEATIDRLHQQKVDAQTRVEEQRKALADYLRDLDVE